MWFAGIDVGTSGARVALLDADGSPAREARARFDAAADGLPPGWSEQRAEEWWPAVVECFTKLRPLPEPTGGVSVTSTSGTILLVDEAGRPARPALMYNDARAQEQARRLEPYAARHFERFGYGFPATFALPKLLWLAENEPGNRLMHAGDFVLSRLTGEVPPSDCSTALKTGCDPVGARWPDWFGEAGVPTDALPDLGRSGARCGEVCARAAEETGLPAGTPVMLGASDGVATMVGAGAAEEGEWASILGTTLVVRGVARGPVRDRLARMYAHPHPDGLWLPGGASNVGGECLETWFPGVDFAALDRRALLPSEVVTYPLVRTGERLPFASATAVGFFSPEPGSDGERYAACLQGVAMVERWVFELAGELGAPVGRTVFAGGRASFSPVWTQLRADVTRRTYRVCEMPTGAAGAAILAASESLGGLAAATRTLTKPRAEYSPDPRRHDVYEERYALFRRECAARGLG